MEQSEQEPTQDELKLLEQQLHKHICSLCGMEVECFQDKEYCEEDDVVCEVCSL